MAERRGSSGSSGQSADARELFERNRSFYDFCWRSSKVRRAEWFTTWSSMRELVAGSRRRLEIGPGVRPRLPLEGAVFLDLSRVAATKLRRAGARAVLGSIERLPFGDGEFDLICAMDVIEHVEDHEGAFREVSRTLAPGGLLVIAVPLHPEHWTQYDVIVGHRLRYEPGQVLSLIERSGLEVIRSAGSGILPPNRRFIQIGAWVLGRVKTPPTVWFEDRLILPIARLFEKPPVWRDGFHVPRRAAGLMLLCRHGHTSGTRGPSLER
jgi:SAM-dependent methyltransferase